MEEIKLCGGDTIDIAVNKLLKAKKDGRHAYCRFNDTILYSDTVTIDSAYLKICGCTKAEWEEKNRIIAEKIKKEREEREKAAIRDIPNKIEIGKKLIYPSRYDDWAEYVKADAEGMYLGGIMKCAIEIMTAIEEGKSVEELKEIFDEQGHSGWSAGLTRDTVMRFSKNGFEFYKAVRFGEWDIEECDAILEILRENEENNEIISFEDSVYETKREVSQIRKSLIKEKKKLG